MTPAQQAHIMVLVRNHGELSAERAHYLVLRQSMATIEAALRDAPQQAEPSVGEQMQAGLLKIARQFGHIYWGAGEKDCPDEIKAPNGELFKLRCKKCGEDNPKSKWCSVDAPSAPTAVEPTGEDSTVVEPRDEDRYQLLRRGQHWSVIDGVGDVLRGDDLDVAIDSILAARASKGTI